MLSYIRIIRISIDQERKLCLDSHKGVQAQKHSDVSTYSLNEITLMKRRIATIDAKDAFVICERSW